MNIPVLRTNSIIGNNRKLEIDGSVVINGSIRASSLTVNDKTLEESIFDQATIAVEANKLYTWIKWSEYFNGFDLDGNPVLTDEPVENSNYIGVAYNQPTQEESENPELYSWSKIRGEQGEAGATGPEGKAGSPGISVITSNTNFSFTSDFDGSITEAAYSNATSSVIVLDGVSTLLYSNVLVGPTDYTYTTQDDINYIISDGEQLGEYEVQNLLENGTWTVYSATCNNILISDFNTVIEPSTARDYAKTVHPTEMNPDSDTASIVYIIIGKNINGDQFKVITSVYFSKTSIGPGVVYRGNFDPNTIYFNTAKRRDIVYYPGIESNYWMTSNALKDGFATWSDPSVDNDWTSFGAEFSSIATGVIISEESYVKNTLNIGTSSNNVDANMTLWGGNDYPFLAIGQSGANMQWGATGVWLGVYDKNGEKGHALSIGDRSNSLLWDGEKLIVVGTLNQYDNWDDYGGTAPAGYIATQTYVDTNVAVSVELSKQSSIVSCEADGTPISFIGTGTKIQVLQKSTYLTYVASNPDKNQFTVSYVVDDISSPVISGLGSTAAIVADYTSIDSDLASVTFTIIAKNAAGDILQIEKIQNITKLRKGEQGLQGTQGLQGSTGNDGIPGPTGEDGKSTYFHIKYSEYVSPTLPNQISDTPNTYIGTLVDNNPIDSTDPLLYLWSKFIGFDGATGLAGPTGTDGQSSYLHIAYADDAVGNGFTQNSAGKSYIGQYVDNLINDSNDWHSYKWTKILGATGMTGATGITGSTGLTGSTGVQGPGVVFRGEYATGATYYCNEFRKDVVQVGSSYYLTKNTGKDGLTTWASPPNATDWGTFSKLNAVATELLLTDNSVVKTAINIGTNTAGTSTSAGNIVLYGGNAYPYISLGQATIGYGNAGFFLGSTFSGGATSYRFSLGNASNYIRWTGSGLEIQGSLTLTGGESVAGQSYAENIASSYASSAYTDAYNDAVSDAATNTTTKINEIKIGGRNLITNSKIGQTSNSYGFAQRTLSEPLKTNTTYTLTVRGNSLNAKVGYNLSVYIYKNSWTWSQSLSITSSTTTTKSITFTTPSTLDSSEVYVTSYYFPNDSAVASSNYVYTEWYKLEEGNKATDWTPAPEDTQKLLDDIASDSKLTPNEKVSIKREWDIIVGEYTKLTAQATALGVTNTLTTHYNALNSYLNLDTISPNSAPLLSDLTTTSDIVSSTFTDKFKNYTNGVTELTNTLTNKVQTNVDKIEVGGINLLQKTDIIGGSAVKVGTVSLNNYLGLATLSYSYGSPTGYVDMYRYNSIITPKPNQYYTLSFYAKASSNDTKISSYFYPDTQDVTTDGYTITNLTTSWKRYSITWHTKSNISGVKELIVARLDKNIGYNGAYVLISGVKFEEGNKATAWSPAPEDVENSIKNGLGKNLYGEIYTASSAFDSVNQAYNFSYVDYVAPYTGSGLSTILVNADDDSQSILLPWIFKYNGVDYDHITISSNSAIFFGDYQDIGGVINTVEENFPYPALFIHAGDRFSYDVSYGTLDSGNTFIVKYNGKNYSTTDILQWEVRFYKNTNRILVNVTANEFADSYWIGGLFDGSNWLLNPAEMQEEYSSGEIMIYPSSILTNAISKGFTAGYKNTLATKITNYTPSAHRLQLGTYSNGTFYPNLIKEGFYAVSFWYKVLSKYSYTSVSLDLNDNSNYTLGNVNTSVLNEWKKYEGYAYINNYIGTYSFLDIEISYAMEILISDIKVETGKNCTEWTQNEDDINAKIPTNALGRVINNPTPTGKPGLYLGESYLGYHDGSGTVSGWKTYMANDGKFALSGLSNNSLSWDGSNLTIVGYINALQGGTVGGWKIETDSLNSIDNKLILSGVNNEIELYDDNGYRKFWANGATSLPNISSNSISYQYFNATTYFNSLSDSDGVVHTTSQLIDVANLSTYTPTESSPYSIKYNFTSTGSTSSYAYAYGDAYAYVSLRLLLYDNAGNLIKASNNLTASANGTYIPSGSNLPFNPSNPELSIEENSILITKSGDVAVKNLKIGDIILSYDWMNPSKKLYTKIIGISSRDVDKLYRVTVGGKTIDVSDSHEFSIERNVKVMVQDIVPGRDHLFILNNGVVEKHIVDNVEEIKGVAKVYSLNTDYPDNYFSNYILSHNIDEGGTVDPAVFTGKYSYLPQNYLFSISAGLIAGTTYKVKLEITRSLRSLDTTYDGDSSVASWRINVTNVNNKSVQIVSSNTGLVINGGGIRATNSNTSYLEVSNSSNQYSVPHSTKIIGTALIDGSISANSIVVGYPSAIKAWGTYAPNYAGSAHYEYKNCTIATNTGYILVTLSTGYTFSGIANYHVIASSNHNSTTTGTAYTVIKKTGSTFEIRGWNLSSGGSGMWDVSWVVIAN